MRKLKHKKIKWLSRGHTQTSEQGFEPKSDCMAYNFNKNYKLYYSLETVASCYIVAWKGGGGDMRDGWNKLEYIFPGMK